ncbi:uncharacterized protein LOC128558905 [Mercenaria mercenaria]|uniref:uncharacterized protein LOC128558905 n=1 Tax=Mercenaria mercenaria TaxID=6596 RepID=UPI00234EEF47|nr:uncharacterized protein LOC128558905 [Mercenaria mercenaria]
MRTFIEQLDMVTPLQPREAFFGGRTEAFTLYKEANEEETIDYYDVTSLYPFINKTGKIPLGHPRIITENFAEIDKYEGLIKCKVIPPRDLFIPVLPCKMNGKLLFSLCKICAESYQQTKCLHTNEERAFIGTWVTDEVKKAIDKGYTLDCIYEVWHFENISQYDPVAKEGGLFTEYVNTFLKVKQEKSGWPKWCKTEEQKQTYIEQYYEKEGVLLDYSNIEKNPGMRALAKLMLNSFWGKFGQKLNKNQVEFIDEPALYFEKLTSDREEVTAVNFVSNEMVEIRWKYKDEFVEPTGKTNVVIAAYTTAQARLKLYSYLEKLGPRALYADTDSVVFTSKVGDWMPSLGDYLGDLTDEIQGNHIKTFVASGPKSYGYQLENPDESGKQTHCKIKGITLNFKNQMSINFETIKDMIIGPSNQVVMVTDSQKICRDRDQARLLTMTQKKKHRIVFDKRVRDGCISYPYGY